MVKRRLARVSKIRRIAELVAQEGEVRLADAAYAVYGSRREAARMKVARLLAAYRADGKTDLRVRGGKVCRAG